MYDESVFLQAPASGRSEEGRALLVTRERCMFDVRVRILRLCVFVCVVRARTCARPGRLTSLFSPPSPERCCLPAVVLPSPNLSRTGATRATMYIQVTRQQTKKRIHFGLFLIRVLAESQNAQIQVKPDNLNDEGLG